LRFFIAIVALSLANSAAAQNASSDPSSSPEIISPPPLAIEIIGRSPVPGIGVDRDKVPSNVQSLPTPDTAKRGPAALATELDQRLGSVNVNANQDNPFQPDIQYRGFDASPILGTPIGVVVYQNGIRINEPFGDNLNWDLVPNFAIDQTTIIPSNPVYGLNALGGALVLNMKDGFSFQGADAEASGGSFGRRQFTLQFGKQVGNIAAYFGANAYNDDGFRKLSPSQVRQVYADIGAESERIILHLNFTGANNKLVGVGPTPIQLVDVDRSAVFTSPQKFDNTLLMPSLNASVMANDTLSFQGNFYLRSASRKVFNGNTTDAQPCADPTLLCLGDNTTPLNAVSGAPIPSSVLGGGIPGENDNSSITSLGLGGSLQGTETRQVFGRNNSLVLGVSLDHADVDFS
jgi:iron complex outermembrane receptor protein